MAILDSIFRRPRLYDNNYQIQRTIFEQKEVDFAWTVPDTDNLEIISIFVIADAGGGIRFIGDYWDIRVYDGQHVIYKSSAVLASSNRIWHCCFAHGMRQEIDRTSYLSWSGTLPRNMTLNPSMVMKIEYNNPQAQDTINYVAITAKRWKI